MLGRREGAGTKQQRWPAMGQIQPWFSSPSLDLRGLREDRASKLLGRGQTFTRPCTEMMLPGELPKAGAEKHSLPPRKCVVTGGLPEGYWASISSKISSARQTVTHISSFIVVMCYVWALHPCVWALVATWVASVMNSINFTFLSTVKRSKPLCPLLVPSWGQGKTPSWKHHITLKFHGNNKPYSNQKAGLWWASWGLI